MSRSIMRTISGIVCVTRGSTSGGATPSTRRSSWNAFRYRSVTTLIGCFSADDSMLLATAFEPYQELFQGVIVCVHSDFRIGGLKPNETKQIRGKLYVLKNDIAELVKRYEHDFPEHLKTK